MGSRARIVLYTIAAIISLAGLADATYLTVAALTGETDVCAGSTGCFEVLGSKYARIAGIPVAVLGVWAYFAAFTFAIFAGFGYARARIFFAVTVWAMFAATLWFLVRASLRPARLLPVLLVLGRIHFPPGRPGRCESART